MTSPWLISFIVAVSTSAFLLGFILGFLVAANAKPRLRSGHSPGGRT